MSEDQFLLKPYQCAYVLDPSMRKGMVKSRRVGGTYAVTLDASMHAAGYNPITGGLDQTQGENEFLISASLYQAEEMLKECRQHIERLEERLTAISRMVPLAKAHGLPLHPDLLWHMFQAHELNGGFPIPVSRKNLRKVGRHVPGLGRIRLIDDYRSDKIKLVNGREISARPANPDTVRGATGNLTFDEFGVMPHSYQIWAAAKPIVDPNNRNPKGYKLRLIGTPLGDDNMFYRLAKTDEGKYRDPEGKMREVFSWHWIDVYRAKFDGFPARIDELRREAGDEDIFRQEYCCEFLSSASRYIPEHLLDGDCSFDPADREIVRMIEKMTEDDTVAYGGMDVARSPTGDYSAMVVVWKIGDIFWVRPNVWAERGVAFTDQKDLVSTEIEENGVRRICLDASGLGMNMAEDLEKKYKHKVESVKFTAEVKEDLVTRVRRLLEQKRLRIPTSEPKLRRDLLSLKRMITTAGTTRFDVERSRGLGHGDRAWALALALLAADKPEPMRSTPKWRRPKNLSQYASRYRSGPF